MTRLDLRDVPTWERPPQLLRAFQGLAVDESMCFITDHEPRPLVMRLEHLHAGEAAWVQRQVANREWEIELTRIDRQDIGKSALSYLRRSIFARTKAETRDALAAAAKEHTALEGALIYHANEMWEYLGFLAEGLMSLSTGAGNGRERVLFEVLPFEAFGVVQVLDHGLTLGELRVISRKARYFKIPLTVVYTLAQSDPAVGTALGLLCAQRARALAGRLAQVSHATIARLAAVLLPYAPPELGLQIALPPVGNLTQTQLASAAGTVKEVAARAIAELEANGALRRERGHVRFLDRNRLLEYIQ
ncbi:MAG: DUF2249 domain-containing protein [Candidatus Baltobacteraceae bacterium]